LDNLVLQDIPKAEKIVKAVYELENILVEGSCGDMSNRGIPPRGLELILGDRNEPHEVDTMVMSNLGYFQLKSNPGVHTLQLSQGRASDIYQIINHNVAVQNQTIVINSFNGAQIQLQVKKRVGKENEKLFVEEEKPNVAEDPSLWSSVAGMFGSKGTDAEVAKKDETIHVFSLASGHLYERFLKIMMLSVAKHSSKPVKFWLLKNFLSPKFREYVPQMAKAYNFTVELMTFKWPAWLQKQTEKQRIIWGYKILFLDVLFPLDVNKVIYVDADQVVRADLAELWNMDLQGRVYGYTPFCSGENMREETKGFRFWDAGYWHDYLRGKPYHISALYVVDLWKMRKLGIGDQIRAHYDGLSKDPNSLANLDQDLPNYLQHQIPIFSLPQEWLWCETWCTDESKPKAKTIDMCNNPLTKKPKLENAVRIVEEWTDLDNEAKTLDAILESAKNTK
jgi:UDP-glucose:glycoprotein glucosyltransferase